jgi:hypothetical protein
MVNIGTESNTSRRAGALTSDNYRRINLSRELSRLFSSQLEFEYPFTVIFEKQRAQSVKLTYKYKSYRIIISKHISI